MGEAHVADEAGHAHRLEEVLVVGGHRAVGADADGHARVEHLAHGGDAAAEPEVARGVVGDGAPGAGQAPHVVVGEPDAVGADEVGTEQADVLEPRHRRLAPAALRRDRLDLRLRQVCVHADPVLAGQARAAFEELVGALGGDRRGQRDADAAVAGAVQAANRLRAQAEQLGGRRRLNALDGPPQFLGQQVHETGDHLVEDDVGDGRGQHRPHAHVRVRARDRLHVLAGWRRDRHEEVVRGRAAGLEHLDGADRGRDVMVLDGAVGVERGTVVQEVLEGPAPGKAPEEVVVAVRVGVDEARHHEKAARVDVAVGRRPREPCAHRGDAVAFDKDVGALERGRVAAEDLAAADEERHGGYFRSGSRSFV